MYVRQKLGHFVNGAISALQIEHKVRGAVLDFQNDQLKIGILCDCRSGNALYRYGVLFEAEFFLGWESEQMRVG